MFTQRIDNVNSIIKNSKVLKNPGDAENRSVTQQHVWPNRDLIWNRIVVLRAGKVLTAHYV